MTKTQSEPEKFGWYRDSDGEAWLHDENGWRLLDGYGSGGGFEVDNARTWEEVSKYGPIRKAGVATVMREIDTALGFASIRVAESGGTRRLEPVIGLWYGVGNLFTVREVARV